VPEVWIVDARGRRILRYLEPDADGYRVAQAWSAERPPVPRPAGAARVVDELFESGD